MTLKTRTAYTQKTNHIDCDGVQLTNAQCHIIPIAVLQYEKLYNSTADQCTMSHNTYSRIIIWKILNSTIEIYIWIQVVNNNNIVLSDTPSWPHQLLVCICLLGRAYFDHLECYYNTWYVYTAQKSMMTSSNGNIFRVTGHLCGEFTVPRWIPYTKASDAELWCLLWSAPE